MTELHALRDAYRSDKAALLAAMKATGASTRGIRVLLRTGAACASTANGVEQAAAIAVDIRTFFMASFPWVY